MPANKYDCFAASLPMLKPDGGQGLSVQAFLDDCEQQLTSADFQALAAARLGAGESSSHAVARAWQQHDREVRDLQDGEALFKLHWQFLDSLVPASFFNLDYLAVYYLKLQLLERQQSFNYEAGHEVLEQVRSGLASFGSYTIEICRNRCFRDSASDRPRLRLGLNGRLGVGRSRLHDVWGGVPLCIHLCLRLCPGDERGVLASQKVKACVGGRGTYLAFDSLGLAVPGLRFPLR